MATCPGTPRPSAQDVQDYIDKRDMVFGLGGNAELSPRPSPRNPSRGVPTPDRTYRSLFQQPAIDVQLAHTEHDWYDFLFQPAKLLEHTRALLADPTSTPTAHDVLTELLKKVKNPATAYSNTNPTEPSARHNMLLCLAALVVLQLKFDLADIEATVPTQLQSLLLDGLVEYATNPRVLRLHEVEHISIDEASVLRARWQLRIAVKKMHISPLTLVGKLPLSDNTKPPPDEVEQLNGISLPSMQHVLDDLDRLVASMTSRPLLQHLAFNDMGVYHFHKKQFAPALQYFTKARETTEAVAPALAGYIQACEAVLGTNLGATDHAFQGAWDRKEYSTLLALLQAETHKKAANEPVALSPTLQSSLEAQVLQALPLTRDAELEMLQQVYLVLLVHRTLRSSILSAGKAAVCQYHRVPGLGKHRAFLVAHIQSVLAACPDAALRTLLDVASTEAPAPEDERPSTKRQRIAYAALAAPQDAGSAVHQLWARGAYAALRDPQNEHSSPVVAAVAALMEYTSQPPSDFGVKRAIALLEGVVAAMKEAKQSAAVAELPIPALDALISLCAGLLQRAYAMNLCEYRISYDLVPYSDLAIMLAFGPNDAGGAMDPVQSMKLAQSDVVKLHQLVLTTLLSRSPREPRWHVAMADVCVNPIVLQKLSSVGDYKTALRHYLAAASLATNFFAFGTVDLIDQSSLVRLSHCLVKLGAHVPAAVLYQCFQQDEVVYGLRMLQLSPQTHDAAFFQYFWELPFLEMLVHVHATAKQGTPSHVQLLTQLLQCPELNASNPVSSRDEMKHRILRSYFRELCRVYLVQDL
ncbi:hypothetical protein SPRG_04521 [Saprolegnia parasitica CBS 223.65]|uniref:INTS8 TPR repeats domain-containing protein n=1 Tax=Saprolegnia parasitica (strain CBS 223.65) TaxID=695850 RepID=A0A067CVT7_SAPPC|nr:hypothetical protein SPRG_04521 [Saprolegnia parasitica CBS 223.65]KDO30621.1 hypothetical protein SPRG_04521 [Saprolegnia parasitica CBS 223.65]|eukprot:XP_012198832.1 hypothetical protein SPRG_04521 [Saprolegnia parasitica CBS 223.65]